MRYQHSRRWAVLLALSTVGGAYRSAGSTPHPTPLPTTAVRAQCALHTTDSVYLTGGPVYRDCAVEHRARLRNPGVRIDWRAPSPTGNSGCFFAVIELVVDTAGRPEAGTAKVVQSNESGLGRAALETVPTWRYEPARIAGTPVRQIVQERKAVAFTTTVTIDGRPTGPPTRPPRC